MSDLSDMQCALCGEALERVRYFPRQLLTAEDMRTEQEYWREKARRHNRFLHGWGVVCGLTVEKLNDPKQPWTVRLCPGYAVGPQGDEIYVNDCVDVDLKLGVQKDLCTVRWPCPPTGTMPGGPRHTTVYLAVRYAECFTRPVHVHPAGCGCDESLCEYSRIRDSFEVKALWELPESHVRARKDDEAWCAQLKEPGINALLRREHRWPVPPCSECESEPWVVVATIVMEEAAPGGGGATLQIGYHDRRTLLAVQRLQTAVLCIA